MSAALQKLHSETLADIAGEMKIAAAQIHEHASVVNWAGEGLDKVDTNFHWRWIINNARDITEALKRYDRLVAMLEAEGAQ